MKRIALALGVLLGIQSHAAHAAQPVAPTKPRALASVLSEVRQLAAKHQHPIVMFDLDDTLFTTQYRNLAILKEWAATPAGAPYRKQLDAVTPSQIGYDNDGVLLKAGVPATRLPEYHRYWTARFFTSAYLRYDRPEPGAVAYVQAIAKAGARIVYLTGRSTKMGPGTQRALVANGFPWHPTGASTLLDMKPTPKQPDIEFKAEAVKPLAKTGAIVADFDNEPAICNRLHQALPTATCVYIDTPHSPGAPPLDASIAQIRTYDTGWR